MSSGTGQLNNTSISKARLQPDPFLNELTNMFEQTTEKGSVWVTFKHSSDKSKIQRNKMQVVGEKVEFKCLIRATDGKRTISTLVGPKDHQRFQASYATILKARMTALKKRERKEEKGRRFCEKEQQQLEEVICRLLIYHSLRCVKAFFWQ